MHEVDERIGWRHGGRNETILSVSKMNVSVIDLAIHQGTLGAIQGGTQGGKAAKDMGSNSKIGRTAEYHYIAVYYSIDSQAAAEYYNVPIHSGTLFDGGGTAKDHQVTVHCLAVFNGKRLAKDKLARDGTV
jgi:hypothetical protein